MKKILTATVTALLVCSLVSCGKKPSSDNSSDSSSRPKYENRTIGISLPTQDLERWSKDGEYLKSELETAGYKVILEYADNDADKQKSDIDKMISDGVNLLLITPVKGTYLADSLKTAKSENISVVAYDRLIMRSDAVSYYISYDNYAIGKLQGEYIRNQLHLDISPELRNIEFISGDEDDNNAKVVFQGAYGVLKEYILAGRVSTPSDITSFRRSATLNWDSQTAKKNLALNLNENYADGKQLDAVVCSNDSMALGVCSAIDSTYLCGNTPLITGQDCDIENLRNIVDGKQGMTVYKNFHDEARVTYEICRKILDDEIPTSSFVDEIAPNISTELRYDANAYNNGLGYVQSFLLTPCSVTADNLQYLVDTGYYKWDSAGKYLEPADAE